MAKETRAIKTGSISPTGMIDNMPLDDSPSWFAMQGLVSNSERYLQRCNGKVLARKFPDPVLSISGLGRGPIFVETTKKIYLFDTLADFTPPTVPLPTPDTWLDISSTGNELATLAGQDDAAESFVLPWSFPYYGNSYTTIWVSTNGTIQFVASPAPEYAYAFSVPFPDNGDSGYNTIIAPYCKDQTFSIQGGTAYYQIFSDKVIIQWQEAALYGDATSHLTYQVVLHDTGSFSFIYQTMTGINLTYQGQVGYMNDDSTKGASYDIATVASGLNITIPTPS